MSALRLGSSISKFIFVFILAKTIESSETEDYILISSTVSYLTLFLGLDYYVHSNRAINELHISKECVSRELNNLKIVHAGTYSVLVVVAALFGCARPELLTLIVLATVIAVFEHSTLEQYRLLNILDCQREASALVFLKTAFWMIPIIAILLISPSLITLTKILLVWAFTLSATYFLFRKKLHAKLDYVPRRAFDIAGVLHGIKRSAPFFISSVYFRLISVADKYLINAYDNENLIKYGLMSSLCGGVALLFEVFIIFPNYPSLMSSAHLSDKRTYRNIYIAVWNQGLILAAVMALAIIPLWFLLIQYLGYEFKLSDLVLLFIILTATILNALSAIPNTGLYALHIDGKNIQANLACGTVFIVTIALLIGLNFLNVITISCAIMLSYLALMTYKFINHHAEIR